MRTNILTKNKMRELYKDDLFYDVESLDNVFTCAHFYPKTNILKLFYKIDNYNEILAKEGLKEKDIIKFNTKIDELARDRVLLRNPNFAHSETPVCYFYDLNTPDGFKKFLEIYGIADCQNKTVSQSSYPAKFYPIKDTDTIYDKEKHGMRYGYNSYNYDTTILAEFFHDSFITHTTQELKAGLINFEKAIKCTTAKQLRTINNDLFEEQFRKQMPSYLAYEYDRKTHSFKGPNYQAKPWAIRKSWLLTGRHIDVAKLNDHMRHIGLKRLLGMLGKQILESDKLQGKAVIQTIDELLELFAYNASDVINLYELFKHNVYQSSLENKSQLLEEIPEIIYEQDKPKYQAKIDPNAVRKDRLTIDSSSAKFVENCLCPYSPALKDNEFISFMYPSPNVCEKLSKERGYEIKPTNILEDNKEWFEKHIPVGSDAHNKFMEVYNFYKEIEGKNVNESESYARQYGDDPKSSYNKGIHKPLTNKDIKQLMVKYNTNLPYFDKDGNETSCFVTFSVGGIHGQEVNKELFEKDFNEYTSELNKLKEIQALFNNNPEEAAENLRIDKPKLDENGNQMFFKNGKPKTKKEDNIITLSDGTEVYLKDYVAKATKKVEASWKEPTAPQLFSRATQDGEIQPLKLNNKYVYTSIGPADHMDFTSYYPLLLTQLEAFYNPALGHDRYYEFFEDRKKFKKLSKDKSLPKEKRDYYNLIQNGKKLILNSASGAGDAGFDSNIRMNNITTSMRIIGQLFAWRIGQAQAFAGARVPSTNTDGLYVMDIEFDIANQILNQVADKMYIGIEPEPLDLFVSKDSNNRLEVVNNNIENANGASLTSYKGPSPTNNLDHPAIVDKILAEYLATYDNAPNREFNREFATNIMREIWKEKDKNPVQFLCYMQLITASSDGTARYYYGKNKNGEVFPLQSYNRAFLTKNVSSSITLAIATKAKLNLKTWETRRENNEPLFEDDEDAKYILQANGFELNQSPTERQEAKSIKVKGINPEQNFIILNDDLNFLDEKLYQGLINILDVESYLDMVENTFTENWQNPLL